MNRNYSELPNGYLETIQKGIAGVRRFSSGISRGTGTRQENLDRLKKEIETADAIVIGAGAGLSTAAGFTYSGERFEKYFFDFAEHFGIRDIYSGGFYPFPDNETRWAWWARHIYFNRYVEAPKSVYRDLYELVKDKDYFVITTNVDHQFQTAGFDKKRLFYTQGDYGLFQSVNPQIQKTYDNEDWVMQAMEAQGFIRNEAGVFDVPPDGKISMRIPAELIPKCPDDGSDMTMNLRSDDTFVEDEGWHKASAAYSDFLRRHEGLHVLFLEVGVGANTPIIVKYCFWQMTNDNENAVYACLNYNEACCPRQIEKRSIVIDGDSGEVIKHVTRVKKAEEFVSLAKGFSEKYGIESEIKRESAQISVWLYFRTQKQRFMSTMKEDFANLIGMADNMLIIPYPRNKADSYDYALVLDLATHRIIFKGQDLSSI